MCDVCVGMCEHVCVVSINLVVISMQQTLWLYAQHDHVHDAFQQTYQILETMHTSLYNAECISQMKTILPQFCDLQKHLHEN